MSTCRFSATGLAIACLLVLTFALSCSPALAGDYHKYLSQITEVPAKPGVSSGPLNLPTGLATDSGNLYVADAQEAVVDEFNSSGEFVQQFSAGGPVEKRFYASVAVNYATGEVYATGIGVNPNEVDVFSPTGTLLGEWNGSDTPNGPFSEEIFLAFDNTPDSPGDPASGDVYVADKGTSVSNGTPTVYVFKPEADGKEKYLTELPPTEMRIPTAIAVNSLNGDVILAGAGQNGYAVQVFKPKVANEYEHSGELAQPPVDKGEFGRVDGVTTDPSTGHIYVSDVSAGVVYEYLSSGTYFGQITGTPGGPFDRVGAVAVGASGALYVAEENTKVVDVFSGDVAIPDVATLPPNNTAGISLKGTVNPTGTTITACQFEYGLTTSYGSTVPCSTTPSGTSPVAVAASLTGLSASTIYHYRLAATDEEGITIYGQDEFLYTPPTIDSAGLASNVTSFAATLTDTFEPGELTPTYHFVYGTTSAYGSTWPHPDAGAGAGSQQTVSQRLTGLQPSTTYHFALVATNVGGYETTGPDETFTTRPLVPPAVSTGGSEAIAQTTATLTGAVNPEGLPTTYRFEYGPSTGYGSGWPLIPVFAGTSSGTQGVALAVPHLQPGTTYHYRLVATNEDGITYGTDQTFATPAYPVSMVQEPATLPVVKAAPAKTAKPTVKHRIVKKKKKKVKARKKTKKSKRG